tara:strand:- start:703 stop:1113 length:411 start_codon:yes stop_codon:yes gene_type:complete
MNTYKKETLIASYPAYDVYKREANSEGVVNISADDILVKPNHRGKYQAGSVVSYALDRNECPIEAIERCKMYMVNHPHAGHKLHWINALASGISDSPQAKYKVIEVHHGMRVKFEGVVATIERAPNNNLRFEKIQG